MCLFAFSFYAPLHSPLLLFFLLFYYRQFYYIIMLIFLFILILTLFNMNLIILNLTLKYSGFFDLVFYLSRYIIL